MDRSGISKRIIDILDEISRLNNTLYSLNTRGVQQYPENFEVLSTDAALRGEQIACRLRHLVYTVSNKPQNQYLESAAQAQGIDIWEKGGVTEIKLPTLLAKRDKWKSMEFLMEPFTAAMNRYVLENVPPRYEQCVVCFISIYDRMLPDRAIRDTDSVELKRYLDVISSFLLTDDSAVFCDSFSTIEFGEECCTRIVIMDKSRFPRWIAERERAESA